MGADFIIDKLTGAKIYGLCKNGREIEMSITFLNNDATVSVSPSISGSTISIEAKFSEITMAEIVSPVEDVIYETSEELDEFLGQFIKE